MLNVQTENFQFESGIVEYKGKILGKSKGPINFIKKTGVYEVRRDSLFSEPECSITMCVEMEISMTLIGMGSSMDMYFDENERIDSSIMASSFLNNAGDIIITTVKNEKTTAYKFSDAILIPFYKCYMDDNHHYIMELIFRGGNDSGDFYMEKI